MTVNPDAQLTAHGSNLKAKPGYLCLFSAGLLILSFPPFNVFPLIWIALVPLLLALRGAAPRQAFGRAYLAGLIFFVGILYWFVYMAWSAQIPLALSLLATVLITTYLAVYFGVFGWAVVRWRDRPLLHRLILLPALWVALEFLRGHLLSGFGWLFLGHSQSHILPVIQIADVTGVYGISFLIVAVNVLLAGLIGRPATDTPGVPVAVVGGLTLVTLVYGAVQLNAPPSDEPPVRIALVQGNVPLAEDRDPRYWPRIMNHYMRLTEAAAATHPDLIIWPETSFPGYPWQDRAKVAALKRRVADFGIPLLLGAVTSIGQGYHNTAILVSAAGETVQVQHKLHLVPFGEYLPLRRVLPFLADLVPIEDFVPGPERALFPIPGRERPWEAGEEGFGVVICFEDTVPRVVRPFVRDGARVLVNMTNDAWFGDTAAPLLHLQAAVFRAVENRRPLVRAANTGVSAIVDASGRVRDAVRGARGRFTDVAGFSTGTVRPDSRMTFYTKYGDIFTYLCFLCILLEVSRRKISLNSVS